MPGSKQSVWDGKTFPFGEDPYDYSRKAIFGRWKPFILSAIAHEGHCTRFSQFSKQLPISDKVLTATLRELEQDGLIARTVFPEVPPRVEYSLTPLGEGACELLRQVYDWGWHSMRSQGLPVDPLGEMWHGYRDRDETFMAEPFKTKK